MKHFGGGADWTRSLVQRSHLTGHSWAGRTALSIRGSKFGSAHALASCSSVTVAPRRSALERFACVRSAPVRSAPDKSAPCRRAPNNREGFERWSKWTTQGRRDRRKPRAYERQWSGWTSRMVSEQWKPGRRYKGRDCPKPKESRQGASKCAKRSCVE